MLIHPEIQIKETIQQLKLLSRRHPELPVDKRIELLIEVKRNPKLSVEDLNIKIGLPMATIRIWLGRYKKGGLDLLFKNQWDNLNSRKRIITKELHHIIETRLKTHPSEGYASLLKWIREHHAPDLKYFTLSLYIRRHFASPKIQLPLEQLEINETLEELKQLMKLQRNKKARRIEALLLIKRDRKYRSPELARILKVSRGTFNGWILLYKQGGIGKLLAPNPIKKPRNP